MFVQRINVESKILYQILNKSRDDFLQIHTLCDFGKNLRKL